MEAHLEFIHGGDAIRELLAHLRQDEDLRGTRFAIDSSSPAPGDMGVETELLVAIIGQAGTGVALLTAVTAWLSSRRDVTMKLVGPKGTVELTGLRPDDRDEQVRAMAELVGLDADAPP